MTATLVDLDDADLRAAVAADLPVAFRHTLVGHPLLQLGALADVAERVPETWLQLRQAGDIILRRDALPAAEEPAADLVRGLATNGHSIRIYYLELVPDYSELGRSIFGPIERALGDLEGGVVDRNESAFLASPGAVTALHVDRHHNLLMQVDGWKDVSVGTWPDADRSQREMERNLWAQPQNPTEIPPSVTTFRMGPGDGLYLPPYAFHWTKVTDGASVALSAAFSTRATLTREQVLGVNKSLRRIGLRPTPPGQRPAVDRAKVAAASVVGRLRHATARRE